MQRLKLLLVSIIFMLSSFSFVSVSEAKTGIVNPNQTYTYSEMVKDIGKLKEKYSDLVNVKVIGKSEFGREIYAFSIGKGEATVFINGSHHAREWLTTNLNMYMADQYLYAYKYKKKINGYDARKILNSTTIWFVPMVNPDGVTLQQSGLKAFPKEYHQSLIKMNGGSKNFKRWKANGKGIDLNRQYDANWKQIKGPSKPSYKNYKGKAPHTAAETKAILAFINEIDPEMTVAYHSSGKILYWNFKQNKERYKRDLVYAKKIGSMTGYRLVYLSYGAGGGGLTDWFVETKKRPGFTPEISRYYSETNPPISEFSRTWKENKAVGLYVAQEGVTLFDKRFEPLADKLANQYKGLEKDAKKLKDYYYTNITSADHLINQSEQINLYNKVNSSLKKLEKSAENIPVKFKGKFANYSKSINVHLSNSYNFAAGINAGEKLEALNKSFNEQIANVDSITPSIVESYYQIKQAYNDSENLISKMYGENVRTLASEKYLTAPKATLDQIKVEMDRNDLIVEIEKLIQEGKLSLAKEKLINLKTLEQSSTNSYPLIHQSLMDKSNALEEQINRLEQEGQTNTPVSAGIEDGTNS